MIVLSNTYAFWGSATWGLDLAALTLGRPYPAVLLGAAAPAAAEMAGIASPYQFGADFFQPNATLQLAVDGRDASLDDGRHGARRPI